MLALKTFFIKSVLFFTHTFQCAKIALGCKPCLLFAGEEFDQDPEHKRLKSLLIGMRFRILVIITGHVRFSTVIPQSSSFKDRG